MAHVGPARLAALLAYALGSATVQAVPPPPPPQAYVTSWQAIERLGPFLGRWTGDEVLHLRIDGKAYDNRHRVFWDLTRLGGNDAILLAYGADRKPASTEFSDVLVFDPASASYRMFLPGYRLFTGSESTSRLVPVTEEAGGRLTWSVGADGGGRRQTSLWLADDGLHERVVVFAGDGTVSASSEATLAKAPG